MKAIHPHYSMPPPQHKAPLLKLLPQDMLDAAEKHDQSTFFARQGHSQQQLRQTSGSGISKSARRAAARRAAQARAGGSTSGAATQPAGQPPTVRQPVTPRNANKNKNKGNSVGDPKSGAPKGQ